MKTSRQQNTLFFKGPKIYNQLIFNNIILNNNIQSLNVFKKVVKSFFVSKY